MNRQPLRNKAPGQARVSQPFQLPAPTKGWYVGANIADAPPGTAYILQNVFPQLNYLKVRGGSQAWAVGMPSNNVSTLMPWVSGTSSKLFAVCNGSIYDVTSSGTVPAAGLTGLSNSNMIFVEFAGSSGSYLFAVNGVDSMKQWNGTAWSSPAITGTSAVFSYVTSFKNRLYMAEANSLNVWYLGSLAISGAATQFPMQGIFKYGGYIMAIGSWAIDSTSGIYESFCVITSEGEVAMYDGSDPSTWSLKGTYKISKPLGPNCLIKAGGDMLVLTQDGIVPMSQVQTLDQIALQNVAVTQPIQPAWRDAVIARSGLTNWTMTMWPLQSLGIVNLPKLSAQDYTQYVVNARTGAWASYVGWDANSFAVFNNNLYYGTSDGKVMQADVGSADGADNITVPNVAGTNYTAIIFHSFTDLGTGPYHKQLRMAHPYITSNFYQNLQVNVNVDFDLSIPNSPPALLPPSGGPVWDTTHWDVGVWTGGLATQSAWQAANAFGTMFAPIIQVTLSTNSQSADIRLMRTDLLFETAEIIA